MEVVTRYDGVEYKFIALTDSGSEHSHLADSLLDVLNSRADTLSY